MKTIFLSIWHNGWYNWIKRWIAWIKSIYPDKGAIGNWTNEYDVSKWIVDAIMKKGVPGCTLIKVPEGLNLDERIDWINARYMRTEEPFAFEFHLDSAMPTAVGASVWYRDWNTFTSAEWKQFLAEFTNITWLKSRHVNSDMTNRWWKLWFVRKTKCASLLVELGFISNPVELATIKSKWADAIIKWFIAMNSK